MSLEASLIERNKTWGREMSFVLLLYLMYLGYIESKEILEILVWPVFTLTFWSFGVVRNAESLSSILSSIRK